MFDETGEVITELRADSDVTTLVGNRIRGFEPAAGDALGPGAYQAFIVVVTQVTPRDKRVPIQRPRFLIKCYGTTPQNAMAVYVAASDCLHEKRVRMHGTGANRRGIWNSWDDTGGSAEKDPGTGQPFVSFIAELIGTTQAVPA